MKNEILTDQQKGLIMQAIANATDEDGKVDCTLVKGLTDNLFVLIEQFLQTSNIAGQAIAYKEALKNRPIICKEYGEDY